MVHRFLVEKLVFECFVPLVLPHLLPVNNLESLLLPLSSPRSEFEELVLRELASDEVRSRLGMSIAPIISSSLTSDLGDVLWKSGSRISVNLEDMVTVTQVVR